MDNQDNKETGSEVVSGENVCSDGLETQHNNNLPDAIIQIGVTDVHIITAQKSRI
jgi:hypothetical protein